jgi:hypothetical protein
MSNEIKTWQDYPRLKDKVAIVGFAPTTRELAPFDDPEYEIWIVNEEYALPWCKRYDRVFQMHQKWDFGRSNNTNHPNHPLWLRNQAGQCIMCKGEGKFVPINAKEPVNCEQCNGTGTYIPNRRLDLPIYMQEAFPDIPGAVAFPLDEATKMIGRRYFRSSFSYMMTMAMLMGYKRIEVYGFEMGTETEYHYQKANGEYLIGVAVGMGFDVYVPDKCTLLKGNVYGYEESRIGYRQNLETRRLVLDNQVKARKSEAERFNAQAEIVKYLMEHPELKLEDVLNSTAAAYNKATSMLNFVRGAKMETENLTQMYDQYFTGPSEKEDPIDYNFKIIEKNVKVEYAPQE